MESKDDLQFTVEKDVHSPSRYRVNNVMTNSIEFQQAFKCSAKSKMVSKNPCNLW